MKQIISLLLLLFTLPAWGQVELPKPRDVDRDYRREYRQAVREYNRMQGRIDTSQWDVFIGPGETVPTDVVSAEEFRAMSYTNWYRDLVSPESLAADMVKAAKRRGVINITDTGCDTDHQDIQKGKLPGSNYTADPCLDKHGHGTHVLGIAYLILKPLIDAGYIEVKMSKFLDDRGRASFGAMTGGVKEENAWMYNNYISQGKFAVANGSWGGGTSEYKPLADELRKGRNNGIVWVFAAGNTGLDVIFPGLLDEVTTVSSLDKNLQKSSFSSFGPEVDFAAGGRDIYSTLPGGKYGSLSGTSMGSPAVAAAAAAALCFHEELTVETLPGYLAEISTDLGEPGKDDLYGWGLQYIRAIIDNPPGDGPAPPDPPTCTDGVKNGKETGVDCGGLDCPPCEPEKPPYRARELPLRLSGDWVLRWFPVGAKEMKVTEYDLSAAQVVNTTAASNIIIKEIGFTAGSVSTVEWELSVLEANAKLHWRNRGLGTPAGWDVYDAARYILFFLDLHITKGTSGYVRQDLKPAWLVIEYEGQEVYLNPADLVDYE